MKISTVEELENHLSEPTPGLIETMKRLEGDIIVLGAGGKMGPTLTRMAKRASDAAGTKRRVIGASIFPSDRDKAALNAAGVETIDCDFMDQNQLDALPDAPNVVFMVGMKFGSVGAEALTWAINVYLPGMVAQRYAKSRIVAFSSGNIYKFVPVESGGSDESCPTEPIGDYAMSVLGRERILDHFSRTLNIPTALIRLNYAVELRYGVLVDIAQKVWAGEPVDVANGCVNVIWQKDANAMILQAFEKTSSPPFILNVSGPEFLSVRNVAEQYGEMMGKKVSVTGTESKDALLSNGGLGYSLYGRPETNARQMMEMIADWVMRGGESIGKPTHFETRDGKY